MFPSDLFTLAKDFIERANQANARIITAESCTGGLIASLLTEISGSSTVIEGGFVTYSNEAKQEMLAVDSTLLQQYGAVSKQVSLAMAEGALDNSSQATISVSVTGIAGPNGGTKEKPVGLVHMATAATNLPTMHQPHNFNGNRNEIRLQTVEAAIKLMLQRITDHPNS